MGEQAVYDKTGREIVRGDIVKVFHFVGARGKRHYMYKQCLGVGTYPNGTEPYVFFSHLNFIDQIGKNDGPYHEHIGTQLRAYEIVQSVGPDFLDRPKLRSEVRE